MIYSLAVCPLFLLESPSNIPLKSKLINSVLCNYKGFCNCGPFNQISPFTHQVPFGSQMQDAVANCFFLFGYLLLFACCFGFYALSLGFWPWFTNSKSAVAQLAKVGELERPGYTFKESSLYSSTSHCATQYGLSPIVVKSSGFF